MRDYIVLIRRWGAFIGVVAFLVLASAGSGKASPHAVIEIGSKGVKGFVFDIERADRDPQCDADEDRYIDCLNLKVLPQYNVNPIDEASIGETAKATAEMAAALTGTHAVPRDRIYVVGSSGVAKAVHRERLKLAVEDALGINDAMAFVTAEQEASYAFEGVLGLIPARWREERRKRTVLVDIGSGNTKGAFWEKFGPTRRVTTFELPWGTKSFTEKVNRERASVAFAPMSESLRTRILAPEIRKILDNKQGAANRDRVYLIGGVVWALTALTQPDNRQRFPRITIGQITGLQARLHGPDALGRLCAENPDAARSAEIEKVCGTFTLDNLQAGLQIVRAFSDEMHFEARRVFFIRESMFAWPLGYVRDRLYGNR